MAAQGITVRLTEPTETEIHSDSDIVALSAAALLLSRLTSDRQVKMRWTSSTGDTRDLSIEVAASFTWRRLADQVRTALGGRPGRSEQAPPDWFLARHDDRHGKAWLTISGPLPTGMPLDHLGTWVSNIASRGMNGPRTAVREVPTLTVAELDELDQWNRTERRLRTGCRLEELFEAQVRKQPDATAVTWSDGSLTYQELDRWSRCLADALIDRGAGPGDVVGILLPRGWQQVAAVFAVLYTGAAYVPLDPGWPGARQAVVLRRCESRLVVTGERSAGDDLLPAATVPFPAKTAATLPSRLPPRSPDDLAYVIFTSGSTGDPKGVMIDHAGAVNTILDINDRFAVVPADRVVALSSLSFDLSVYDIFGTLAAGATIVCLSEAESKDPRHWLTQATSAGVTIWNSVPALLQAALSAAGGRHPALHRLRLILLSGDRIPLELPRRARSQAPHAEIISLGGATEASIWSIFHPITQVPPSWTSIPYGRPLANQQFHVLDEHLQPLPEGAPGELYIGGAGLARGYWRASELNAESFRHHPRYGRLYRTGDLGVRTEDGVIDFLGRRDQQVKIRGFRIELGEVEAALHALPRVSDAAAAVHRTSTDELTLVAHVVSAPLTNENEVTTAWRDVFDQVYARSADIPDEYPEFTGWTSAYTGEPFPVGEMTAWADAIAGIVLEEPPRRVLEIGCGTGILVRRLAAHAHAYHAADPSDVALAHLQGWVDSQPDAVILSRNAAHELAGIPSASADTVVLSSVVQYFPSAGYLIDVLSDAVRIAAPGGRIIIGDVRHLGLLPLLYADIEVCRASDEVSLHELRERIAGRAATEQELAVDPALFHDLRRLSARIGSVEVRPRDDVGPAELSKYRYDVVLRLDTSAHDHPKRTFAGLDRERVALDLLNTSDASTTAAELAAAVDRTQSDGRLPRPQPYSAPNQEPAPIRPWDTFTNRPRPRLLERALIRRWRDRLEQQLPAYMVPSLFVIENELPLTGNGKIDRQRLRPPSERSTRGAQPDTAAQLMLAEAWSEALGLNDFGIEDNFLELGGTSLSATVALHHLAARGFHLRPEDFFRAPTLAVQASFLTEADPAGPVAADQSVLPLSDTQAGLLAECLADPEATTYVVHSHYQLTGQVSVDDLNGAWHDLHTRHPLLGATLTWDDNGKPQFDLSLPQVVRWQVSDLRDLGDHRSKTDAAERLRTAWLTKPMNTDDDGLAEAVLIRLDDERSEILWRVHHVVMDGWSLAVSERDFWGFYDARRLGRGAPVKPLPTQGRYLAWHDRQDRDAESKFWAKTLDGVKPCRVPLVADAPGRSQKRLTVHIGDPTAAGLAQLARARRLTITTILHGAWALLLSRYTGTDEVTFGITSAGRPSEIPDIDEAVGSYVVTLPLRSAVPRSFPAAAWLTELQEHRLRCQSHEHASPGAFSQTGQSHGEPLFDTAVITDNHPANRNRWQTHELVVTRTSVTTRTQWPLTLFLDTLPRPRLTLQFDSGRIDDDGAAQIAGHLATLLEEIVQRPDVPLGELKMLSPAEQQPLSGHSAELPSLPVDLQIATQSISSPDAIAITSADEDLTYRRLERRVRRLAETLQARGLGSGSLIGVCLPRRADLIIALLAVLRCGGAYLPLDPDHPPARSLLQLEDSHADAVLVDATTRSLFVSTQNIVDVDAPAEPSPSTAAAPRSMDDTAYVIYTSGSTGRPKAVQISHRSLANALSSFHCEPGIRANDRLLAITTIAFDIAALELFLPLMAGARVVLAEADVARDATALTESIREHEITLMQATPTTWRMLITNGWRGAGRLRCLSGGEVLPRDLADVLLDRTSELWNLYGPTETTIWSLTYRVEPGAGAVPLGRPLAHTRVHVLDTGMNPVPRGAIGELHVEGLGLAQGYWNQPELTRTAFARHPRTGARLYRTGDYVRRQADGHLEFVGRRDDQIKFRGARIEPAEVEGALRKHPQISDSVVVLRDERLIGYLLTSAGGPGLPAVRRYLSSTLPRAMVPTTFVFLDHFPLTANGKVDRRALPDPVSVTENAAGTSTPRSSDERLLAKIWSDVLGVRGIGIHDDFFDLGGDSITALQIVIQARRHGLDGTQRHLFQHPTIAEFVSTRTPKQRVIEESPPPGTGPETPPPTDFPLAGLTSDALADVLSALDRRKGRSHG